MKLYGTVNTEVDVSKYNILIAAAQILYDGHLYDSWGNSYRVIGVRS